MMIPIALLLTAIAGSLPRIAGHASIFHPSMWGFNVTAQTFPYDNRPVAPLINYTFDQWWFHGHLDYPPNDGDFFELPAGKPATSQIACDKGATTFFASDPGGNIQNGDDPCPGSPPAEYHTTGLSDVKGCSLAITYKSNVSDVKPTDFTVFSVNQTCVWTRFTDFQVPARMPPCPEGGCICSFFWIHSPDSGSEQNYMNGFRCNVTGSTSDVPLATPQLARRCGADPANGKPEASPGNCTYGAKQPFYWFQAEDNNMFEGTYAPPFYNDLYNFLDGAQEDIFQDSYPNGIPQPSPNQTLIPTPNLGGVAATSTPFAPSIVPVSSSASVSSAASSTPSSMSSSFSASSSSVSAPSTSISVSSVTSPSPPIVTKTATVVSTLLVTVTAAAPSSPTPPSSRITASSSSPGLSVFAVPTITLNRASNSSVMITSSAASSAQGSTSEVPKAALFEYGRESGDAVLTAVTTATAMKSAPTNSMCKSTLPSRRLRRRSLTGRLEGVLEVVTPHIGEHKKLQDRGKLWRLF